MREAIRLARDKMRENAGGPFGAVIVRDGGIIARGWNQVTSANDPTAHAEIMAIREACARLGSFRLDDCEIYASCEPCPMCLSAIYWARLRKVYFASTRADAGAIGFDDETLYREVARPIEQRSLAMERLQDAEAMDVLTEWQKRPDKVRY